MKIFNDTFGANAHTFYERFQKDFRKFYKNCQLEKPLLHYLLNGNSVSIHAIKGIGKKQIQKDEIVLVFENGQIGVSGESELYPELSKIVSTFTRHLLDEHYNFRLNRLKNDILLFTSIVEKHNRKYSYKYRMLLENELPYICNDIELLLGNLKAGHLKKLIEKVSFERGANELSDDIIAAFEKILEEADKRMISISKL